MISTTSSYASTSALLPNQETDNNIVLVTTNSKKLHSFWFTIILSVTYFIIFVLILPVHFYCNSCQVLLFSIIILVNVALFLLTSLFTFFTFRDINKLQKYGYGNFYKKLRRLVQVPFVIFSLGNALIIAWIATLFNFGAILNYNDASYADQSKVLYFLISLQVIVCLEVILSLVFLITIAVKIKRFNASKGPPEVLSQSLMPTDDSVIGVALTNEGASSDLLHEIRDEKLVFMKRRCILLGKALRHVVNGLPSHLKRTTEKSLENFLETSNDADDYDDLHEDLGVDVDMIVA